MATRSRKKMKKKLTCITDYSFGLNSNVSDYLSRSADYEFKMRSKYSRHTTHRWATDRKVSWNDNAHFCLSCSICVCVSYYKLLQNEKDIIDIKKDLLIKFL